MVCLRVLFYADEHNFGFTFVKAGVTRKRVTVGRDDRSVRTDRKRYDKANRIAFSSPLDFRFTEFRFGRGFRARKRLDETRRNVDFALVGEVFVDTESGDAGRENRRYIAEEMVVNRLDNPDFGFVAFVRLENVNEFPVGGND